jgi:hypothetical protein
VLPSEEYRPCNPTGIFALQEQTLGLAILKSKDFVVTADVELALGSVRRMLVHVHSHCQTARGDEFGTNLARIYLLATETIVVGPHDDGPRSVS